MEVTSTIQPSDMLVWKTEDITKRLQIRRADWLAYAKLHQAELKQARAIVKPGYATKSPKYRVSVMRPWLDDHLEDIFGGKA